MDENLAEKVRQELTNEVYSKLIVFATRLAKRYVWRGGDLSACEPGDIALPQGNSVRGIVSNAIIKVMEGRNKWDPQRVKLTTCLMYNIRRDICHLYEKKAAQHERQAVAMPDTFVDGSTEPGRYRPALPSDPRALAVENELLEDIYCSLDGEDDLIAVFERMLEGKSRKEVATELHLTPDEITNTRKRLSKRLEAVYRRHCDEQ